MEIDEHWRHSNRRQIIKIVSHLIEARQDITKSIEHARLVADQDDYTKAIYQNINAITDGINETIIFASEAADKLKQEMETPDAIPAPIVGGYIHSEKLTPFQRALQREGVNFNDVPTHVMPTKTEQRTPKLIPFELTGRKQYPRQRVNIKKGIYPL
jgi:hypothetical protein